MSDSVTVSIADGVADVRFNRPEKLNSLNLEMLSDIVAVAESLSVDRSVRSVVLSGQGPAFCAGLDLKLIPLRVTLWWELRDSIASSGLKSVCSDQFSEGGLNKAS